MITEKDMKELKLGDIVDIAISQKVQPSPDAEPETKNSSIDGMRLLSIQYWIGDAVLYRFESVLNDSAIVLNKDGQLQGDFRDYTVEDIVLSEPRIIKNLRITEKALSESATNAFGAEADKIVEFIKNL